MAIGTLAEKSLHAALKLHYALPGDLLETPLDGYVIDILRPVDGAASPYQCIEIQTKNLAQMKPKLLSLVEKYPVRVVHPVAQARHVVRVDGDGVIVSRRKTPMKGTVYHVFPELLSLTKLIQHPNFSLEVLLIHEEQVWLDDGRGSWRRKHWSIHDRRLLSVGEAIRLETLADFVALLPAELDAEFETVALAKALKLQRPLAGKMAYCLRQMGVIEVCGKRGRAYVYRRV